MRAILAFLLAALPLQAQVKGGSILATVDYHTQGGGGLFDGDTPHFTAWTGAKDGGNFNGGRVFGTANDTNAGCGGAIGFIELVRIDFGAKSNTKLACANPMAGYGNSGALNFPPTWTDNVDSWKTFNPWSLNGTIFLPINRQTQSNPWHSSTSSIIMTPDHGAHWCNSVTYNTYGGCTSAHWSATGDAPANASQMMFGVPGDTSHPNTRPMVVQFCQDQSCNGMPFDGDNYLYFVSATGDEKRLFSTCVAKNASSIMDKDAWWYHTTGNANCGDAASWTHNPATAVKIADNNNHTYYGLAGSVFYLPKAGVFVLTSALNGDSMLLSTSQYPWGPFKRDVQFPSGTGRQTSAILATLDGNCPGCGVEARRWQVALAAALPGHSPSLTTFFHQVDLSSGAAPERGRGRIGGLPGRIPIQGAPNRLILSGLAAAYDFGDWLNHPLGAAAYKEANTYSADLTGNGNCLVTLRNNGTTTVFTGTQSSYVSYSGEGIRLGGDYSAQITSRAGDCGWDLPISGDSAFTIQMILKPENVTGNGLPILEAMDPSINGLAVPDPRPHREFALAINSAWQAGKHLDFRDYGPQYVSTSPSWNANSYYLLTIVKTPGPVSTSTVKIYLGATEQAGTNMGSPDGQPPNFSDKMMVRMGCWSFGVQSYCNPGDYHSTMLPATHSFFAVYTRALSADEVNHNYEALKEAMARVPRNIVLE
jgi:hypothetical protein